MENDDDNDHNQGIESHDSDEEENTSVGMEAVDTSFHDHEEELEGDFGEFPIYVPTDTESAESERAQEDPSSRGSLFSNQIVSDDTTLVGSSQISNLVSSKRDVHNISSSPSEDEKQDYETYLASSRYPKRARGEGTDDDVPIVVLIE
jgi:hypothetical protein